MPIRKEKDTFSKKQTQERFEAALRGARLASPQPMKSMTPKRGNAQSDVGKKRKAVLTK